METESKPQNGSSRREILRTYPGVIAVGAASGILASTVSKASFSEVTWSASQLDETISQLVSTPDSDATSSMKQVFASVGSLNVFREPQIFSSQASQAFDYSGTARVPEESEDGNATYVYRAAAAVRFVGGTNGARGDDVSRNDANSRGASFGNIHATFVEDDGGFKGRGSIHGYYHRGILGPHPDGAYGELGGAVLEVTNNRSGGLAEAAELKVNVAVPSRSAALVSVLDASVDSGPYWSRGHWIVSSGRTQADEAILISGTGGWKEYLSIKDGANSLVFRLGGDGSMQLGDVSMKSDDGNLLVEGSLEASSISLKGSISASSFGSVKLPQQRLIFGTGNPNGSVQGAVGSLFLSSSEGISNLWVKESGNGNEGWIGK